MEIRIVVRLLGILSETTSTWQLKAQQIILPPQLDAVEKPLVAAPPCRSVCVQMRWQLPSAARC